MATLNLDNSFVSYNLTPEEELAGSILALDNLQVIQNKLSMVAHKRINVDLNTLDPLSSLKDVSWLDGQIQAYRDLLDSHHLAVIERNKQTQATK